MSEIVTRHEWDPENGSLTAWIEDRPEPIVIDRYFLADLAMAAGFTVPKIVTEYLRREAEKT